MCLCWWLSNVQYAGMSYVQQRIRRKEFPICRNYPKQLRELRNFSVAISMRCHHLWEQLLVYSVYWCLLSSPSCEFFSAAAWLIHRCSIGNRQRLSIRRLGLSGCARSVHRKDPAWWEGWWPRSEGERHPSHAVRASRRRRRVDSASTQRAGLVLRRSTRVNARHLPKSRCPAPRRSPCWAKHSLLDFPCERNIQRQQVARWSRQQFVVGQETWAALVVWVTVKHSCQFRTIKKRKEKEEDLPRLLPEGAPDHP